jgi:hypothetical protein
VAIAHDSTTVAGNNQTGQSATWNHTVASGGVLLVVVSVRNATDASRPVSSVTYDGVNLTKAVSIQNDSYDLGAEIWYLKNPTTGSAKSVVVTLTGSTGNLWSAAASSFTGCDTSTLVGATQTASASSTAVSLSLTPNGSDSWIIDAVYSKSDAAITAGQTQRSQQSVNASGDRVGSETAGPVSGATTKGWSWSSSGQAAVLCAVEILVAASGTTYTQGVSGSLTAAGALALTAGKLVAGSLSGSGVVRRQANKRVAGSLTGVGGLVRRAGKGLVGSLTASGALAAARVVLLALAGSLTASGSAVRRAGKGLAGSLTASGVSGRRVGKGLVGSVTAFGALEAVRAYLLALAGALTASGGLGRSTGKGLAGDLVVTGGVVKQISIRIAGVISACGALLMRLGQRHKVHAVAGDGLVTVAAVVSAVTNHGVIADGRLTVATVGDSVNE